MQESSLFSSQRHTCNGWIKSFFPLRDTRVMDESSLFSSSVCFVGWVVDAQHIERRITLLSWYQIDLKRAWLRTVRSTPLIRSEGSSETTLIKQENLDNGAWLWSGCKTDESGGVHWPRPVLQTFYRPESRDSPGFTAALTFDWDAVKDRRHLVIVWVYLFSCRAAR